MISVLYIVSNEFNENFTKVGPSLASSTQCSNGEAYDYLGIRNARLQWHEYT